MRALTSDPLRNFKFLVTITPPAGTSSLIPSSIGQLGFMNADGFGIQNEVIAYREGGDNTTTRKMPGQTDFGPITFSRGMMSGPVGPNSNAYAGTHDVYSWLALIFSAMEGAGLAVSSSVDFRTNLTVDILEHPLTGGQSAAGLNNPPATKARFYVYNAWPMGVTWSGLDAGGNAVLIETLQLAHEGFTVAYAPNTPGSYLGAGVSTSWFQQSAAVA